MLVPEVNLGQSKVLGEEALEQLQHSEFALILLKYRCTGLSGLETARIIRGQPKTQSIPIIFLTAFDTDNLQMEQMRTHWGRWTSWAKPLVPIILRAKVAGLCSAVSREGEGQ